MEKILISGGTGLVGQALIPLLKSSGFEAIAWKRPYSGDALAGATAIINLAGESIASGRWTSDRKHRILDSRVHSLSTIRELVRQRPNKIKTLISASATGYYGSTTSDHWYSENDPPANDFLGEVCQKWESSADAFSTLGIRVVKIRIGVVLSTKGGALPKMMLPLKFGFSSPLGSGSQWLPWIYIDDLTEAFRHLLIQNDLSGSFNAVAPNPVTNRDFMRQLARKKRRIFIPVGLPGFIMKAALGEMASVTLEGSRISGEKLTSSGFTFRYPDLESVPV